MAHELERKENTSNGVSPDEKSTQSSNKYVLNRRKSLKVGAAAIAGLLTGSSIGSDTVGAVPSSTAEITQPSVNSYGGGNTLTEESLMVGSDQSRMLAQTEDNEEIETALEVSPGTTIEATLEPKTVDWITFPAASGDPIEVEYQRSDPQGVTGIILYGPEGNFDELIYAGSDSPVSLGSVASEAGSHFVQIVDVQEGDGDYALTVRLDSDGSDGDVSAQSPYGDAPWTVPGRIQAQDFDKGGEGVAYSDTTEFNEGGEYRPTEAVGIQQSEDSTGEFKIGWMADGEWLEYTVDVQETGTYRLLGRTASRSGDCQLRVKLDGQHLGTIDVPETGGLQSWQTARIDGIDINASGERLVRIEVVGTGMNLNWFEFVRDEETSDSSDDEFGVEGYGAGGYGGVELMNGDS